jgi:hypothetical protein
VAGFLAVLVIAIGAAGLAASNFSEDQVESPVLPPRTPVAGADLGGLFADGVKDLPLVDTSDWKTYSNDEYGYSFMYPGDWEFSERDNDGRHGPNGEPAYPIHQLVIQNPAAEAGENIPGENCEEAGCEGPTPKVLGFYVGVWPSLCDIPGELISRDTWLVDGRDGDRCVIQDYDTPTRFVYIGFPAGDSGDLLVIALERGREIGPDEQAVLETILSTFKFN